MEGAADRPGNQLIEDKLNNGVGDVTVIEWKERE